MSADMEYKILFTGQYRSDISREEIEKNILKIFNVTNPEEIAHFLKAESFIIKKTLSEAKAQQYQTELYKAGLLCDVIAPISSNLFTPPIKPEDANNDWTNLTIAPTKPPEKIPEPSPEQPAALQPIVEGADTSSHDATQPQQNNNFPQTVKAISLKRKIIFIIILLVCGVLIKKCIID